MANLMVICDMFGVSSYNIRFQTLDPDQFLPLYPQFQENILC